MGHARPWWMGTFLRRRWGRLASFWAGVIAFMAVFGFPVGIWGAVLDAAGVRSWPLEVPPPSSGPGFTLMPPSQTGLTFTNELLPGPEAQNHNLLNGSGLALGDFDADGWTDIFLCNLNGRSALFRNLGGWRFADVTAQAGLNLTNQLARGAVFADVDGDGDLDLLVTFSGKGARLYLNDGQGRFTDAQRTELIAETGSTSLALGDIDGDGDLDLYVANYGENTIRSGMRIATRVVSGKEQIVGRHRNRLKIIQGGLVEYGEPDVLYLNDGRGGFTPVPWTGGAFRDESGAALTTAPWELGFSVAIRDINQDGHPDIYVCNDFQDPDRLWLGDGRGGFRLIAREALRSICHFSMTVDFADVNRDGLDDFVVTDMVSRFHALRMRQLSPESPPIELTLEPDAERPQVRRNMLFLNRGDGTYAEIGQYAGIAASDWSWSAVFLDVDLNGYVDLLVGTGHYYDTQDLDAIERTRAMPTAQRFDGRALLNSYPLLRTPNVLFRNRGDLTFEETAAAWGFDSLEVSHSIACADLDNDGDLDVVVNCLRGPALLYRNNSTGPRVAVRLRGLPPNTAGIGSRLRLAGGGLPAQQTEVTIGGHYLAGAPPVRAFAAGSAAEPLELEVQWRSGRRSVVRGLQPGRLYEIDETTASALTPDGPPQSAPAAPWFADRSAVLDHRHQEDPWDDLALQPSLPRRRSHAGPAVAWFDVDGDGADDLLVGASRGQRPALFRNTGDGRFARVPDAFPSALDDDSAGILGWTASAGQRFVIMGLHRAEPATAARPAALLWPAPVPGSGPPQPLGSVPANAGPLALGDLDGDGDLDLFIGGSALPGRYPEPSPSAFYRNVDGRLEVDLRASGNGFTPGLVAAALFADLDGDGRPELVLACEWGPVRIYRFVEGVPREVTGDWGFPERRGLWSSLVAGDFDGDGRLDLVAGNFGLNSRYQIVGSGPWRLYHGDLNGDGQVQILEAYQEAPTPVIRPLRDMTFVERHLPWVREHFPTHEAYSRADVDALLGQRLDRARVSEVSHLATTLFLQRDGHWETRLLPPEAQWSPAMGLTVADFDADGHEDLFISQNFFGVRPEDARLDAGRGLLLRGDGTGQFQPVAGQTSGIRIYGEQRAAATADFDADGRADLVVAQNNGPLLLFQNSHPRSGMRVRLEGPPLNPSAVGAQIRLVYADDSLGPVREIQSGSGFWSQNSPTQILGLPRAPAAVEVRWPGGRLARYPVPPDTRTFVVRYDGESGRAP
jgi:enediyne biosynthesis protein E4